MKLSTDCNVQNLSRLRAGKVGVTRKLIEFHRGERCAYAANKPFWMRPKDCENAGVKTRAAVNKDRAIYRTEIATFVDWNKKSDN